MNGSILQKFFHHESASGVLLMIAALLAIIVENSAAQPLYDTLLNTTAEVRIGDFGINKPVLLWINDGLMALFFFLVGVEIKYEVLAGQLSDPSHLLLPIIAAVGGMAIPAVIYSAINWGDPAALSGWAIPSATDIAFALGVLSLLGSRVPPALKLFLMTLAIVDDLGAIIIIALFYTSDLSTTSLLTALVAIIVLFILNRRGVLVMAPYLLVGLVLWVAVLKSGVHATLAGVIIALFIPHRNLPGNHKSQLEIMKSDLHPSVSFVILPLFAFANAGVSFDGLTLEMVLHPVPLGIALGLLIGNQLGVFGFSYLAVKAGIAKLPPQVDWLQLYGVSLLCGIGFTMSLFIASLAFGQGVTMVVDNRFGILLGSLVSALLGYAVLWATYRYRQRESVGQA